MKSEETYANGKKVLVTSTTRSGVVGGKRTQCQRRGSDDVTKPKTGYLSRNTYRRASNAYVVQRTGRARTHVFSYLNVQRMQRLMEFALPKNIWDAGSCGAVPTTRYRGGRCQGKKRQQYELFVQEYRGQNCQMSKGPKVRIYWQ